jgi:hypothetical protein
MNENDLAEYLEKMFGEKIQDPDVYPQQFAYQVKLAKFQFELDRIAGARDIVTTEETKNE